MSVSADRFASRTAMMVAAYRARASARPEPVCHDLWAQTLVGEDGMKLAGAFDEGFPYMELWIALRTAYLDAYMRLWTEPTHGFAQVVILGAGLDTRAARLARAGVRVFEVDHPASQTFKRERLGVAAGYPIDAATYVPCDFEHDDFLDRLDACGFRADAPALFLWEGVVPYLSEPAIRATLRRVADGCHARTILAFDYLMRRMADGSHLRPKDEQTRQVVAGVGEPVVFGTNDPLPMLYDEGFRYVRTISFDQIALILMGNYDRERMFRFQHVAVASRTVPSIL
jgi:methyltransferase (TIGR00027 family)